MTKKPKTKNFIVNLEVYPFDVMVSLGETDEQLFVALRKKGVQESEFDMVKFSETSMGRCVYFKNGACLIRLREFPVTTLHYGILQHEILHAVFYVMDYVGMPLELYKSDEAYTYLTQFLTRKILDKL